MSYLKNRIDLQVELFDLVNEKVKDLGEETDDVTNSLRFILMSQLADCALRIKELSSVYLHLEEKEYELSEDVKTSMTNLRNTFYTKNGKLYSPNDTEYETFKQQIVEAYRLKNQKIDTDS